MRHFGEANLGTNAKLLHLIIIFLIIKTQFLINCDADLILKYIFEYVLHRHIEIIHFEYMQTYNSHTMS